MKSLGAKLYDSMMQHNSLCAIKDGSLEISYDELNKIYLNKNISIKTINEFYLSLLKYNFFLKFAVINYLFLLTFTNLILTVLLFFRLKYKYFNIILKFFKKIPLLKNVQNFIISFLLLHTSVDNGIQKFK